MKNIKVNKSPQIGIIGNNKHLIEAVLKDLKENVCNINYTLLFGIIKQYQISP